MRVWVEEPRPARGDGELARGLWGAQHIQLQGGGQLQGGASCGGAAPAQRPVLRPGAEVHPGRQHLIIVVGKNKA